MVPRAAAHRRRGADPAQIADRGITDATADAMGLGFAPPGGRRLLKDALLEQGFSQATAPAGRPARPARGRPWIDRFRNRLMIPISPRHRVGHRVRRPALDADQQPKYPELARETPIYSKSRTLYGLNLTKAAIRQRGFAVLGRGLLRFRPGLSGGRFPGGRLVRHGADAAAGAAAAAFRRRSY